MKQLTPARQSLFQWKARFSPLASAKLTPLLPRKACRGLCVRLGLAPVWALFRARMNLAASHLAPKFDTRPSRLLKARLVVRHFTLAVAFWVVRRRSSIRQSG